MPRKSEMEELLNNCTWEWATLNGVKGFNVTGPNGNSIFLPTVGCRFGTSLLDNCYINYKNYYPNEYSYYIHYWTSSVDDSYPEFAFCAYSYSHSTENIGTKPEISQQFRPRGLPIRPVSD
jgi:hypothetical protein